MAKRNKICFYLFFLIGFSSCLPEETEFLSPVPNAIAPTEVSFTSFMANWKASLGVDSYIVYVAEDEEFNRMVSGFPIQVENVTSKTITGLTDGKKYYYRVRGIFNGANTEFSNTIEISTLSFRGNGPNSLIVKRNGDTYFVAGWNMNTDAEGFIVNLALDADFSLPIPNYFERDVGLVDSIRLEGLSPDKTYYFRVKSYVANSSGIGRTISDDSETLINMTLLPFPPEVLPASDITPVEFVANWKSVQDADFYLLDVSDDPLFSTMVEGYNARQVNDTSEVVTGGLDYSKNYYYRVRTNIDGKESDTYSAVQEVNSSLSTSCKVKSMGFGSPASNFIYDAQGRIEYFSTTTRFGLSHFNGSTSQYLLFYPDATSNLPNELNGYNVSNNLTEITNFFYRSDNKLDSVRRRTVIGDFEKKYTYNSEGFLIKCFETYDDGTTVRVYTDHVYTNDKNGNVATVTGSELYYDYTQDSIIRRNIDWEFRYDDKINPSVLLPQAVHSYVPFAINANRGVLSVDNMPFMPTRNITYWKFSDLTEWILGYDYNEKNLISKQLGFFATEYIYEDCD